MDATWRVMPGESAKAYRTFRQYLQLGPNRSQARIAKDNGVTYTNVNYWSRKFGWTKRILAVEEAITQALVDSYTGAVRDNQNIVITDAFNDYNELLDLWRMKVQEARQNENITTDELTKLAATRRVIDDVGRRAAGLPGSIKETTNKDETAKMPVVRQLGWINSTAKKLGGENSEKAIEILE